MAEERPTPFETEARAIDEARTPRTFADGGQITGAELLQVATLEGCHACCHHRTETPMNITVNIHGTATSPQDIARIVIGALDKWRYTEPQDGS